MEPLVGVPYKLYALQAQTDKLRAANCISAVIFALRRAGYACPTMNFFQAAAYWGPRAKPLRLNESRVGDKGALLFTREHFLLLYADRDGDGRIGPDDLVIHAYYRPVEIGSLRDWQKESAFGEIRYLPLDDAFSCPSQADVPRLKARRNHGN